MSAPVFALAAVAAVFAGVSKGGFGSGAAFAASAILALVMPPGQALAIMLPLLMMIDAATLRPYWRRWDWRAGRLLILGALPGVALGAALWRMVDDDAIRLLIGAVALGFVAWQVAQARGLVRPADRRLPPGWGVAAGLTAGFTSFVSHAGGPPTFVYLLSGRPDKTTFQATTVLIFWVVNLAKAVPYALLGLFTAETLLANLALAPFALIGAWIGVKAHFLVPERAFFLVTYALLTATGAKLVWDALM
ncbi:sulfite exporter TauE/SafE family protein [Rhodosalinus sediminis]|uniref:Probable membrane transporter protein n=1 Tax=Rhodosalinus sediminis TaxID=1940533 RepID=A0A3D9BX59_9RHOB|nr:sulfite exporter TauE/SafE family protein [Rhodosalinus sediminis]REC58105.1 sulfite exporter TauE/SafE family protein [Rhodosalinus sediminis]